MSEYTEHITDSLEKQLSFFKGENLYKLLELNHMTKPNIVEIKQAYKSVIRKYHPDINKTDPLASEKFDLVKKASNILFNDKLKKEYDELLECQLKRVLSKKSKNDSVRDTLYKDLINKENKNKDKKNKASNIFKTNNDYNIQDFLNKKRKKEYPEGNKEDKNYYDNLNEINKKQLNNRLAKLLNSGVEIIVKEDSEFAFYDEFIISLLGKYGKIVDIKQNNKKDFIIVEFKESKSVLLLINDFEKGKIKDKRELEHLFKNIKRITNKTKIKHLYETSDINKDALANNKINKENIIPHNVLEMFEEELKLNSNQEK